MALPQAPRHATPMTSPPHRDALDFEAVYEQWFSEVVRWLRALGGPDGDLEDMAQEVFIVVRRQLDRFDGRNLEGWLYRISEKTAADYRRRAWFRRVFRRARSEVPEELTQPGGGPAELIERRELQRSVYALIAQLSARLRATFVLFEIEGYTIDEIAALQGIPPATVRTRLHYARKKFLELVRKHRTQEQL
jgi:RNA polymerase sigma-70 factor, ECF subfamily